MKNGYYLSVYIHIGEIPSVVDSYHRHDQNISLWKKDGDLIELIHYWELERISGIKSHSRSLFSVIEAVEFINELLSMYNVTINDMEEVWGTPQLDNTKDYFSDELINSLPFHSIAHLFSSIFMDTKIFYDETIIGLAVDGGPDNILDNGHFRKKNHYAGCLVKEGSVKDIFPISSPGLIWSEAADYFGLREGTLMALASATESKLINFNYDLPNNIYSMGDRKVARDYLNELWRTIDKLNEHDIGISFNGFDKRFTEIENKISMAVKEIQNISIQIMEENINKIVSEYNIDTQNAYLALSGGYALNCPTNSYLMEKFKFKGFLAPPCINDSGISLGIALYVFYKRLSKKKIDFKLAHPFYGDKNLLSTDGLEVYSQYIKESSEFDLDVVLNDLETDPFIWFDGRAEIGPRALGNRSLFADPRNNKSKDELNRIKQRQWWRPVAPIILEEEISNWFENSYPSPFMLHTFKVNKDKEKYVPAILHLDKTARVQTIKSESNNQLIYRIIKGFYNKTGVPIICNTSLNDNGEPIINSFHEAMNFALRKNIRIVYFNGQRFELMNHEKYKNTQPLQ
ncbi:hypothetical protein BSK64_27095, partial [Paenibacillus odorifer]|uniref:carbamoyltransferase C-terminal domain-containing protein n=3 Tax=Paenibacillus TaxID=44249 RepID=UPI00096EDA82